MRGNRNTKRTEKHKNKMTQGKTYNKSPRRINHKATRSKTNTGTTAFRTVGRVNHREVGGGGEGGGVGAFKHFYSYKDEFSWLILLYARVNENQ